NMLTLITPSAPAQKTRKGSCWGGSVFGEHYPRKWVSFRWASTIALTANDGGGAQVTGVDASGGAGSVTLGASGVLVYTPGESLAKLPAGTVYVDTVSYSVQYADGSTGTATLRVYVNGQYVAPTVEEEDEERFALAGSAVLAGEVPVLQPAAAPSSVDLVAPVTDNVARMALAGMVEMAAAEPTEQAAGPEAPAEPAPDLAATQSDIGKPGLSAALSREVLAKRAGVDALLRHFTDHAA
ncbi:MAG: Ig-like domain-containing protein, partial [Gammaproteobacteria bacterium]